ncbi:28S ribosomal protein S18b, mitochondrial-like isoform X2 [Acropora millepora]|uniref:28S ribosomal protein S18b, mitochondrial-like isoform X2 n=1 Tax=Acropora millepora TaxID=45264 RepID=UPI001CF21663|nr:28S ribosomal protein S18b, mitochondrial-like isoform X2 [Acropora millepora]
MAGSLRGLSKGIPEQFSAPTFARNLHQKFLNSCFAARAFHSHSLNHRWLFRRQCCLRGKERWMDQEQRLALVQKYEKGVIYRHVEDYEKLTLEHFQVFWPGGIPIWTSYRRNFLGQFAPKKTRQKCIRGSTVVSNPCPLCKLKSEKNYTLLYTDVGLLSQFICPHTGLILEVHKTGVCQRQQKVLEKAISEARDKGLLPFTVPGPRDPPKHFKAAGVPFSIRNKT